MALMWKSIYVNTQQDADRVDMFLKDAAVIIPSLDQDEDWELVKEDHVAFSCPCCGEGVRGECVICHSIALKHADGVCWGCRNPGVEPGMPETGK